MPYTAFPASYRAELVAPLVRAVTAGDSVALLGRSGSGKSNLLSFLAHRRDVVAGNAGVREPPRFVLVDCNRLPERTPQAFFRLALRVLDPAQVTGASLPAPLEALDAALARQFTATCLLLDRFDDLTLVADRAFFNNLRALRDAHKYRLTYVAATRHSLASLRPLEDLSEFAELFSTHVLRMGAFSESDSRWNVERYAARQGITFTEAESQALIALSGGYAGLLRGALEAWSALRDEERSVPVEALVQHPALSARLGELWADIPEADRVALVERLRGEAGGPAGDAAPEHLRAFGLVGADGTPIPVLAAYLRSLDQPLPAGLRFDALTDAITRDGQRLDVSLTPKEHQLLAYLASRPGEVCEKDDIIHAVWTEDVIFEKGVRDDSLAQIVRRLREKIERNPSKPEYVLTAPGRGYRLAKIPNPG